MTTETTTPTAESTPNTPKPRRTADFKAQVALGESAWPYVANGYRNRDGSISLLLDRGVRLLLADGTCLAASGGRRVKLLIKASRVRPTQADADTRALAEESPELAEAVKSAEAAWEGAAEREAISGVHMF